MDLICQPKACGLHIFTTIHFNHLSNTADFRSVDFVWFCVVASGDEICRWRQQYQMPITCARWIINH